jgi:hypothetical protein
MVGITRGRPIPERAKILVGNPIIFLPALAYIIFSFYLQQAVTGPANLSGTATLKLIAFLLIFPLLTLLASGRLVNLLADSKKIRYAKFTAGRFLTIFIGLILFFAGIFIGFESIFFLSRLLTSAAYQIFLLALTIPLSYTMTRVAFLAYAVMIEKWMEKWGEIGSLKKSFELADGQFWKVAEMTLFQMMIALPLLLILPATQITFTWPLMMLLGALVTTMTTAWMLAPMAMAYRQLKE